MYLYHPLITDSLTCNHGLPRPHHFQFSHVMSMITFPEILILMGIFLGVVGLVVEFLLPIPLP